MPIRWTSPAAADLWAISDYLDTQESPELARRVARTIYDAVETLAAFPEKGRVGREPGTRELVIQRYPYIVIYELQARTVDILHVLHTSQRWP